jgi:hypothetical protein
MLYQNGADDEFTVKVASTKEAITALIKANFDWVMQMDALSYFRKRA